MELCCHDILTLVLYGAIGGYAVQRLNDMGCGFPNQGSIALINDISGAAKACRFALASLFSASRLDFEMRSD